MVNMQQKTKDKFDEVNRLVTEEKMRVRDACKKVNLGYSYYYTHKDAYFGVKPKVKVVEYSGKQQAAPVKKKGVPTGKLALVLGTPDEIATFFRGLNG